MSSRRRAPVPAEVFASRSLIGLAFGAFVVLGMPKTAFGVAWPTVADDLGRSVAELGVIIVVFTAGYMAATAMSGPAAERVGTGRLLVLANAATVAGLLGYALTSTWAALLAAAVVLGAAGGIIDAAINAHMAVNHGPRVMNLLHASFGVGATLGPLLMTAFLAFGGGWRAAYGALAVAQAVVTVAFWRSRHRWDGGAQPARQAADTPKAARPAATLFWGGLAVFFLYSGIEVGAGVWAASLFEESRGLSATAAGLAVTAYWASFTLGRFAASAAGDRFRPNAVVPVATVVAAVGLAVLWWDPVDWTGPASLVIVGLSLAPIFPALVLLTPVRLGAAFARRAVGYQLAAASLGVAIIPGTAGLLVAWQSLEAVPPFLLTMTLVMLAVNGVVSRVAARSPRPRPAPTQRPLPPEAR